MSHIVMNEETGELHSSLACHVCKKRKIKCGRELPHCHICEQTSQQCTYPSRASRPGPKIGSSQSGRKRSREFQLEERRRAHREYGPQQDASDDDEAIERPYPAAASPGQSLGSTNSKKHSQHIQSLSFIIHPSHECCSPEEESERPLKQMHEILGNEKPLLSSTCFALGLNPDVLDNLIDSFFQTFTAYRLFREPHFRAKLGLIQSSAQINALLAAMFAFSAKEYAASSQARQHKALDSSSIQWSNSHFIDLAMNHIDNVLRDCGDEPPPLCLLQALILTAHWLLIQGVRGRAWRYLGNCVRIAYELNLHLVDAGNSPDTVNSVTSHWCEDEERRRAWWAIWEMDVFASVIRRCPTAIDWSQNETFLPAEDEKWFRKEPQKSCKLASGFIERCKYLQATGNQSPKAWFILVNSLMKEAQTISSPVGINKPRNNDISWNLRRSENCQDNGNFLSSERGRDASNKLSILYNTLRCFVIALPASLKYREQYLTFEARDSRHPGASSPRHLHSSIYSIHLMAQLTKIMICKYRVFHNYTTAGVPKQWGKDSSTTPKRLDTLLPVPSGNDVLEQYFKAADDILTVVHSSSENHFRYVNPFLANTLWLAAAVQLLHKSMIADSSDVDLVSSKFEVLCMTYDQFVEFWEMSSTPRQNLETLQNHLKSIVVAANDEEYQQSTPSSVIKPPCTGTDSNPITTNRNDQQRGFNNTMIWHPSNLALNEPSHSYQKDSTVSCNQGANLGDSHQQNQPNASVTGTMPNSSVRGPVWSQQPSLQDQGAQCKSQSPALSYDTVPTGTMSLSMQTSTMGAGSSNYNIIEPFTKTNYIPTTRIQGIDQGFLDSFNFMHNLGAAANIEFLSYLDEIYPGQDVLDN